MKNITEFEQDIILLEQIRGDWLGSHSSDTEKLFDELKDIYAPILDGSVELGDIEKVFDKYWERFGAIEIETTRKEVEILRRLQGFFEYLANASKEEWEAYVKVKANARIHAMAKQLKRFERKQESPQPE